MDRLCPAGGATVSRALLRLAFYGGRPDQREVLVLFWRHVCVLRFDV